MNAARSTISSRPRRTPSRCAAGSPPWSPWTTWRTGRPAALADGETLKLGRHEIRWFDTPHLPHGWECGLMMETSTATFFCGDLFTQGGTGEMPAHGRPTSSGRAKRSAARWTTTRIRRTPRPCSSGSPANEPQDARLHARQRVAGRWRRVAPRPREIAGRAQARLVTQLRTAGPRPGGLGNRRGLGHGAALQRAGNARWTRI